MGDWKTFLVEGKVGAKIQKWKNMVHVENREFYFAGSWGMEKK